MSVAALQYDKFCSEVAVKQRTYTFTSDDGLLVYPVSGTEVIPFWSSKSRLERIALAHEKYQKYEITEYSLGKFFELLSRFEADGIHVGVNWAGARLTGYNVPSSNLRASLNHRLGASA